MSFTAKDVADLRQRTGAGMMDCKKALKETEGNVEKAIELLRQKGIASAAKKAEKSAADGIIISKISADNKTAAIAEVNTQTDFVAKNETFLALADNVVDLIIANKPKSNDELLAISTPEGKLSDSVSACIAKTGEKIEISRFKALEISGDGVFGSYIHPVGNKIGVVVKITGAASSDTLNALAKDISMHIAACQPQPEYVDVSGIPADVIEQEKRIEMGKEDLANKPKEIAEKIVAGRLNKLLAQKCLLSQPYIKDPNLTIEKLIKEKSKELGSDLKIEEFVRFNVGESNTSDNNEEEKATANV